MAKKTYFEILFEGSVPNALALIVISCFVLSLLGGIIFIMIGIPIIIGLLIALFLKPKKYKIY